MAKNTEDLSKSVCLRSASKYTSNSLKEPVRLRMSKDGYGATPPQTIPQFFRESCKRFAHLPALGFERGNDNRSGGWNIITYNDYERKVEQTALLLMQLGLQPHTSVGILAHNCPEWFYVELGAILAGGVAAGIYLTSSPEAVCHALNTAEATVCVVDDATQLAKVHAMRSELPQLKAVIQLNGPYDDFVGVEPGYYRWTDLEVMQFEDSMREELKRREQNISANDCALLIFTSGTTGMPKAVMLSHDSMLTNTKFTGWSTDCFVRVGVTVSFLPLNHIVAQLFDVYLSLFNGDCVYFGDRDALKGTVLETVRRVHPTRLYAVPRVLEKIQEHISRAESESTFITRYILSWAREVNLDFYKRSSGESKPSLKFRLAKTITYIWKMLFGLAYCKSVQSVGAPLSLDAKKFFVALDLSLGSGYGLSECSGCVTYPSTVDILDVHHVGQPIRGFELRIDNPNNEGCGEICTRGRCGMMGYLHDPDRTSEIIDAEGWVHTGDLGYVRCDDALILTGRLKELIITSGGVKVPPLRIEDLVKRELPCISNAMVVGDQRNYLTILLTIKTGMDPQTGRPLDILLPDARFWLQELGYNYTRLSEVLNIPANLTDTDVTSIAVKPQFRIVEAIQAALDRVNAQALSRPQRVQKFALLPHDFSLFTGELGPTLKRRRPIIVEKYAKIIDKMYKQ